MPELLKNFARVAGLKLLQSIAYDIKIGHHWVPGTKLKMHSFKHKGYWWHGRKREAKTLNAISKFLGPGQTALDVGAHIGYFATYFAHLVGQSGRVVAFEPSEENLIYTRQNVAHLSNVVLENRGISNYSGEASFFVESLTGQNNSLVEDYKVYTNNAARAGFSCSKHEVKIEVTTIDAVCRELNIVPNFIKMDIEGAEFEAVQGMLGTLKIAKPVVLLEVSRNHTECLQLFKSVSYRALNDDLQPVEDSVFANGDTWSGPLNFFFVSESDKFYYES